MGSDGKDSPCICKARGKKYLQGLDKVEPTRGELSSVGRRERTIEVVLLNDG